MRRKFSPFAWFVAVAVLILSIEVFSILGVHMVTSAYGTDYCARLAEGDATFKKACKDYKRVSSVTDGALREAQHTVEESGQFARELLKERDKRSKELRELEDELEHDRRNLRQ